MERIGRYRIEGSIGEGAMAHVYLAHDPSIDRWLAIKVLKAEFRNDPEIVQRFLAESRAAGMLSHAHIVTIFDVGEADGVPYIAMERLEGKPLDEILADEGRITVERALALGAQVADALAYAHRQGVVHRDIKPSNILVCDRGRTAKLLDFGIARIDGRDGARAEQDAQCTLAGQIMGTPRYMSPEQAMGLPVDARTDLFSLGAVLYEMVTGKPAFPGTGLATLAIQIAQQDPTAIESHVRDCPRGLRFIIGKLLAKKPGDRFADTGQLHKALLRELEAEVQEEGTSRRGIALRFKLPLILAATAALALTASVGMVLERQRDTLERMALTSGLSMTDFVARNAALRVADNAGLPSSEQDWLPLQAFVETATQDSNVRQLVIADDRGVIRAAGDKALIGTRYQKPIGEQAIGEATQAPEGFRFTQPVRYGGADFGRVDMVFNRGALDDAMRNARLWLIALSLFVVAVVAVMGYLSARRLSRPLRRLRQALDDALAGNFAFRLSHHHNDELGALFDAFNRLASEMEARAGSLNAPDPNAMLMTRIERPAPEPAQKAA